MAMRNGAVMAGGNIKEKKSSASASEKKTAEREGKGETGNESGGGMPFVHSPFCLCMCFHHHHHHPTKATLPSLPPNPTVLSGGERKKEAGWAGRLEWGRGSDSGDGVEICGTGGEKRLNPTLPS